LTILNTSAIDVRLRVQAQLDRLRLGAAAAHEGGGLPSSGLGNNFSARSSSSFTPAPLRAETKQIGTRWPFAQALLEGVVQVLSRQAGLAFLEVAAHHRLVDLHHLVDDALVRGADVLDVALAVGVEEAVDHRAAVLRRQVDRQALGAELFAQLCNERRQLAGLGVHLVDHQHRHRSRAFATSIMRRVPYSTPCAALTTTHTVSTAENADRVGPRNPRSRACRRG
jgi:hypothetical protein